MLNSKLLQNFLYCSSKTSIGTDPRPAEYAKGAIEGMVSLLMAEGATYNKAWSIVRTHLPESVSPYAIPKGWTFNDDPPKKKAS